MALIAVSFVALFAALAAPMSSVAGSTNCGTIFLGTRFGTDWWARISAERVKCSLALKVGKANARQNAGFGSAYSYGFACNGRGKCVRRQQVVRYVLVIR